MKHTMNRKVKTVPSKSINFTHHAKIWCEIINLFKRYHPDMTFKQIAENVALSETSVRRYYYGIHHKVGGKGYTQVRTGACVQIVF